MQAGRTILKLACQNGNIEIAELLVAARCDINMTDKVRHYFIMWLVYEVYCATVL